MSLTRASVPTAPSFPLTSSQLCAPGSPALLHPTSLPRLHRTDIKMPNFSCVLYVLKVNHRAQVHRDSVHFKKVREALAGAVQLLLCPPGLAPRESPSPGRTLG